MTDLIAQAEFAKWLRREMPPDTYIADPEWWAPRIYRAVCQAQAAQPPAAQPEVAYYVYEWDTAFGVHTDTSPNPWNGMPPTRTVPVYRHPDPRRAELENLGDEVALIRSVLNGYPQSMARADALRAVERIEAALKEG